MLAAFFMRWPSSMMMYLEGCMAHGAWCMAHGAWCMVHGACVCAAAYRRPIGVPCRLGAWVHRVAGWQGGRVAVGVASRTCT